MKQLIVVSEGGGNAPKSKWDTLRSCRRPARVPSCEGQDDPCESGASQLCHPNRMSRTTWIQEGHSVTAVPEFGCRGDCGLKGHDVEVRFLLNYFCFPLRCCFVKVKNMYALCVLVRVNSCKTYLFKKRSFGERKKERNRVLFKRFLLLFRSWVLSSFIFCPL